MRDSFAVGGQALQRLVDGGAGTEIQKIDRRPHLAWLSCDSAVDLRREVQRMVHGPFVRSILHISDKYIYTLLSVH